MENLGQVLLKLEELKKTLANAKRLVVLTHDNPDPDTISCALTLQTIVQRTCQIPGILRYSGIVGRAENREMIRLLKIKIKPIGKGDIRRGDAVALVDSQPLTGNVTLPKGLMPDIVIDHHPLRKTTKSPFIDLQVEAGATATILAEYLLASGLEITSQVATALCYGISSETQHLGRGATPRDAAVYSALFAHANKKILSQIENPKLPRDYFKTLNRGLHQAKIYKHAIVSNLGEISAPDFVPIVADLLLKCERMSWSLVMGRYKTRILVSIRTTRPHGDAGRVLRKIVGQLGTAGGHDMMAGGQVPCASTDDAACDKTESEIEARFLKKMGFKEAGELTPLLVDPDPVG